jgi:DAK2 domain fusion protein YloV
MKKKTFGAIKLLDGEGFRRLIEAGSRTVTGLLEEINALNVFPVPDGDTGTNMALTLQTALTSREVPEGGTGSVAEVSRGIARGALLGARGNSGVIFSQFLKGFAAALSDCVECDGPAIKKALKRAADDAYKAVALPVEGTMLTVMKSAAEAGRVNEKSLITIWQDAYRAAQEALARTPEQLPVLREAGVVDAGGQGFVAFMAGAQAFLKGEEDPKVQIQLPTADSLKVQPNGIDHEFFRHTEDEIYGYCTSFVLRGDGLDVDQIREQVGFIASSTAVVGDELIARIHAHTQDPGKLLTFAIGFGTIDEIKIENMDAMHQNFRAVHGYGTVKTPLGVLAVAYGEGLENVFRELGATVVAGGQTMNPSVADLLEGLRNFPAEQIFVLPNNANVIMTAEQALSEFEGQGILIPTQTIPQGIATLVAFNRDQDAGTNALSMDEALTQVVSGEVTTAVRDSRIGGRDIRQGQFIASLEGKLVASLDSPEDTLLELLRLADPSLQALITVYWGGQMTAKEARATVSKIEANWPRREVELVYGGQPYSHWLVSIE